MYNFPKIFVIKDQKENLEFPTLITFYHIKNVLLVDIIIHPNIELPLELTVELFPFLSYVELRLVFDILRFLTSQVKKRESEKQYRTISKEL